jgi:hypothetical protein
MMDGLWCLSNSGKYKLPEESGKIWALTPFSFRACGGQAFREGDVVTGNCCAVTAVLLLL